MQEFRIIAKTLHNLEDVLAQEVQALGGASDIEVGRRMVSFIGNKALLYKANLRLRTALRILKPILTFRASDPDELYDQLVKFRWDTVMTSRHTFAIDTTVYSDHFTHSKYVGYKAKDAIVDFFRQHNGERPSVRLDNPDIYLNVHIAHHEVTVSLDSSGESLHKRGYREVQTDAPINEVLAAGILLRAGWDGSTDLIDPMCGSGTFLIEAALIARGIAPGIYRQGFAFEKWLDYDAALFEDLYNDESEEREFAHTIYGSDILPNAIKVAERNIARSGLGKYISLSVCPLEARPAPEAPALIVMNPPYGERLKLTSPEELYEMIGERLKHQFAGCTAWIIAYKGEHFNSIGLRHNSRTDIMNGSLECELRSYSLFAGKKSTFLQSGDTAERSEHSGDTPKAESGEDKPSFSRRDERKPLDREGCKSFRDGDKPRRDERRPSDREGRKPFRDGDKPRGDERKPFDREGRKPFRDGDKPRKDERRPFDREGRKPFRDGDKPRKDERRPFDREGRKPFRDGDKPSFSERRPSRGDRSERRDQSVPRPFPGKDQRYIDREGVERTRTVTKRNYQVFRREDSED